jgi:proliferating cell antigen-like protein
MNRKSSAGKPASKVKKVKVALPKHIKKSVVPAEDTEPVTILNETVPDEANYFFFCKAEKGHFLKALIDVLAAGLSRVTFRLRDEGITIRQADEDCCKLYNTELIREGFRKFELDEPYNFSLNLKHTHRLIKNVKKKECMELGIPRDGKTTLIIKIYNAKNSEDERIEVKTVTIQMEPLDEEMMALPDGHYKFPVVINAASFQKIKQVTSCGMSILIESQGSHYLAFKADTTDMPISGKSVNSLYSSNLTFGKPREVTPANKNHPNMFSYKGTFHASTLNQLVKMPSLGTQMQFYMPRIPDFPIKIRMAIDVLGTQEVFVKDIAQLQLEQDAANSN